MSAPYRFDRYRNGRLMAEGIKVNKENCLEDAIKVAARLADHGDVLVYDVALDAALAEIGGARVKPLAWTAKGYAQTPFGKYLVVREDWSGQEDFWFVCFAGKPYGKCGEHSSEEAAKATAQADYEARILAAIEPAPVSVREAARVLLAYMDKPEFARVADKVGEVKRRSFEGEFTVALRTIAEGRE